MNKQLLEEKKARFLACVNRAADHLGVIVPKVQFWEDFCPYDTKKEWAHIHLDTFVICVSELRLNEMTYEKIEETATHEVTHMIDPTHNCSFHAKHQELKIASWRPPGGVVFIGGSKKDSEIKPKRYIPKIDKIRCNYHLCRKKTKLKQCTYCENYY